MRPSTFGALSILLGIILLQAASFAEESEKCPYYKKNELVKCGSFDKTACETDEDCRGQQKCCRELCTFKCKDPVAEKSGQCPYYKKNELVKCGSFNKDVCETDEDCGGQQKCCRELCTFKCEDPMEVEDSR